MELRPATSSDIPSLISIQFSAFEGDPYQEALFPGDYWSSAVRSSAITRTQKFWDSDPTATWLLCTNPEPIGFALWNIYSHERPESEWRKDPVVDWCTGRQAEIAHNFLSMNARLRWKIWSGKPYILLNLLCIHQDWQRRGAGKLLVEWGIKRSEEMGLPIHLEASPAGFGLYMKLGFVEVAKEYVRAEEYDGEVDREYIAMVRQPAGKEGRVTTES